MRDMARWALFAIGRRLVAIGLILAGAWAIINLLRWAVDSNTELIAIMTRQLQYPIGLEGIDWSTSLWTKKPVTAELAGRLGATTRAVGLGGLFSLALAGAALALGWPWPGPRGKGAGRPG